MPLGRPVQEGAWGSDQTASAITHRGGSTPNFIQGDVIPGVGLFQNRGASIPAELALAQANRAAASYLQTGRTVANRGAVNEAASIVSLDTFAYNSELATQLEISNLGAAFESYAMGEGMAGGCGWGSGGSGDAVTENLINKGAGEGTGATGDQTRSNSSWGALQRSLFRARTKFQTSLQSVPEDEDPLFAPSRNLPRALSVRKLRGE
jgi:hypothetical protein